MTERIVKQPPNDQTHFANVPTADIERSTFDRSHSFKGTMPIAGQLIPIFWDEVLPGDSFSLDATIFTRLATPLHPFMDNLKMDIHFFFVANRLVMDQWQQFMGERRGAGDDPDNYTIPQATLDLADPNAFGTLGDFFGLPIGQTGNISVSDLPFRAYELIHYEWYRDQNIQSDIEPPDPSITADTDRTLQGVRYRAKRKDYFTSCLPWAQKGDPVVIPLGSRADVKGIGVLAGHVTTTGSFVETGGSTVGPETIFASNAADPNYWGIQPDASNPTWPNIYADLTTATATTINDLRTAFQIQRLLERDARGGTRYIELVLSHFGVQSPDSRQQRPEFLGSGTGNINVNPVASTYADQDNSIPQGNLAAVGTGLIRGGFSASFTEHGLVIGLASVQSDQTYQHGIERYWHRKTRYDFYWPALAHLGEQAVLSKELWVDGSAGDQDVFGYQERYGEYRFKPGRIVNEFRSNHPTSLDPWHLAQDWETRPVLNNQFILEQPPVDRVIAVPSEPHFLMDAWFNFKCTRPMPVYSVPGMIDHF